MEARLPDLNSRWFSYNKMFYHALARKKIEDCKSYLWSMNDMLADEYKVVQDTEKFNNMVSSKIFAVCDLCGKDHQWNDVEKFVITVTGNDILKNGGNLFVDCWRCPDKKCKNVQWNTQTNMIKEAAHESQIMGVVPDPPEFTYLETRAKYFLRFKKWALRFEREIDAKLANLRNDYVSTLGGSKEAV